MFESVLVADRGEVARRVIRTVQRMGLRAVAVHSDADAAMPYLAEADEAVSIGSAPQLGYRDVDAVLEAARQSRAHAIHPGRGVLATDPSFARRVEAAGLVWVGPPPDVIDTMRDKIAARNAVEGAGLPVARGTDSAPADLASALQAGREIGFPVMVKASAGYGADGMAVADDESALATAYEAVRAFADRAFGDPSVLLERYFPRVRHIEVQILGLPDGRIVVLGERDGSLRRHHRSLLLEAPSPGVGSALRERLTAAAVQAGEAVAYRNAGTVECLVDTETGELVFLGMDTRLQAGHAVTEMVLGIDLVQEQLLVAAGQPVTFDPDAVAPNGHALGLRVSAEDPQRLLPGSGKITGWQEPRGEGLRVDAGCAVGTKVTADDPLLATLVVHGADRAQAVERAREAVAAFRVEGPPCNLPFLAELLEHPDLVSGAYDSGLVARMRGLS